MPLSSIRPSLPLLVLFTLVFAVGIGLPLPARAQTVTANPALAAPGVPVTLRLMDGSVGTSYRFYLGSAQINPVVLGDATFLTPRSGATLTVNLPTASAGRNRIVVRAGTLALNPIVASTAFLALNPIVASTAFEVLAPMSFACPQATVHGGQRLAYTVGNLRTGTLEITYAGRVIAGPVDVTPSTTGGRLTLPTSNPTLPATVRIDAINRIGNTIVNRHSVNQAVAAPLPRPFTLSVNQTPTSFRPAQVQNFSGTLGVGANEAAPTSVSTWFVGSGNNIFPLGEAQPTPVPGQPGQFSYQAGFSAPGLLAGTAGGGNLNGQLQVQTQGVSTLGRTAREIVQPANPQYQPLGLDRWRVTLRVRRNNGTPLPGALAVVEGFARDALVDVGSGLMFEATNTSLGVLERATTGISQLFIQQYDEFGCPLNLGRALTDANGLVTFEFDSEGLLRLASMRQALLNTRDPESVGGGPGPGSSIGFRIGVDASGQGYGYENGGDVLPHVYEVELIGVDNPDIADQTIIRDGYQGTVMLDAMSRNVTFNLPLLPQIDQRVQLLDVTAVPWPAKTYVGAISQGAPPQFDGIQFGPVYTETGLPASRVLYVGLHGRPTHLDVRLDQALSGAITTAVMLFDADRNGSYETNVPLALTPGYIVDCESIAGLKQNVVWRAPFPAALRNGAPGTYQAILVMSNSNGGETRLLRFITRAAPTFPINDPDVTSYQYRFYLGGAQLELVANEASGSEAVQLARDPGYEIGRLRNENAHQRDLMLTYSAIDPKTPLESVIPLDTTGEMGNLPAEPKVNAPPLGIGFDPAPQVLVDESFPLFYYTWGIPILAGVEVGANFSLYSDITFAGKAELNPSTGAPALTLTTTPRVDFGLQFYIDVDILLDLVDAGVSVGPNFSLRMPIRVVDGVAQPPDTCFAADLLFSYWIEFNCLPLDFICEAASAIFNSEDTVSLLADRVPSGCAPPLPLIANGRGIPANAPQKVLPNHATVAYSPDGDGFLAFVRRPGTPAAPSQLVVRPIDGGLFDRGEDDVVLSTGIGIRAVELAWYAPNRALAVWAENSTASYADYDDLHPAEKVRRQRLMYATFNGRTWSAKQALTAPGSGEGGISLAACFGGDAGCPATGEVVAAWVRDPSADVTLRHGRIFHATFGGSGWTAPVAVDAAALTDSAPSVTFVGSAPVVGFVRAGADIGVAAQRRFAYRFIRNASATVQIPAQVPAGVIRPSLATAPRGELVLVVNRDADGRGIVGNTAQLGAATLGNCSTGTCSNVSFADLRDPWDRLIYAERPRALRGGDGSVKAVFRGVGFGPDLRGRIVRRADDPIGMTLHTGELMQTSINVAAGRALPVVLSGDGAGHLRPAAAIDPASGAVIAASTAIAVGPAFASHRIALEQAGARPASARGKLLDAGDLAVYGTPLGPDLAIETLELPTARIASGQTVSARVVVRNRGGDYTATAPTWLLRLTWDGPAGVGTQAAAATAVLAIDAGAARSYTIPLSIPAGTTNDRRLLLVAELDRNDSLAADGNGANNSAEVAVNLLAPPLDISASGLTGSGVNIVSWAPADDDRVIGHRIWYRDAPNQRWRHLGSSFGNQFVDLRAPAGKPRWYRITSYTANLGESPPSIEAVATATLPERVFGDGFEGYPAP
jgi:hypothetical protein